MDLALSDAERAFAEEVRAFLAEHLVLPGDFASTDEEVAWGRRWQATLAEGAMVGIHWPSAYGGRDATPVQVALYNMEYARARAPQPVNRVGINLAGPTLLARGTDEQRARWLPAILDASEIWCQLFSEPDAGSDLAGLTTRAERDGDAWRVTGAKVWASRAHYADRGLLLARTDWSVPKHAGITVFGLDLRAAGVEVAPLVQMNGDAHFNQVFLDGVEVPDADRIGDVGEGWRVAMTTLSNERTTIGGGGGGVPARGSGAIAEAVRIWNEEAGPATKTAVMRDELVKLWARAEVLRMTNIRASQNRKAGNPGPEGSIAKLEFAKVNMDIYEFCVDLLGAAGLAGYDFEMRRAENLGLTGPPGSSRKMFLRARANSIEGGTSEIQRNII
ncbi:MAG: acyl-CoA dehydrogenase family protein, partial [Acidimicrobiales bacterium]|nr:acyl-CoA dehydrogenase family protein [Acidimicrobiales bacterium]